MKTKIKIISKSGKLPNYETSGSAGMDLTAFLKNDIVLKPGERVLISTGIAIALPKGYEAQIRARSGIAIKSGISLVNGVGTIDSDYRGEIKVAIINLGQENFVIRNEDRIAQMVIAKYEQIEWSSSELLDETKRGSGGFGHTGI